MAQLSWRPPSPTPSALMPPSYEIAQVPTETVVYMFSPQESNIMLLLPPADSPDTRPRYHISISFNMWNPLSFITTVRKGATDSAPIVAEFDMGISTLPGTVSMGGITKFLKEVLIEREWTKFHWKFRQDARQHIYWERTTNEPGLYHCFVNGIKLASYQGATVKRRPKASPLTVHPKGQPYFDDIVVSLLILERRRFRPPAPRSGGLLEQNAWWS
uniref:DUF6593 domain-containing protein n=1 Tax=Mycena chlorophos TaxID=658473 RepID=A0ABQ0LWM9_MYCCL|nr:predicted protein [Mycena chlorophos]